MTKQSRLLFSTCVFVLLLGAGMSNVSMAQTTAVPSTTQGKEQVVPASQTSMPQSSSLSVAVPQAGGVSSAASTTSSAATPAAAEDANPYGLGNLWEQGDFIARSTLVILLLMSVGSWYVMIAKYIQQMRMLSCAKDVLRLFWVKRSIKEGASALPATSPFRYIADTGIVAVDHHEGTMQETIDLHTWTSMSIQRAVNNIQNNLQKGMAFLGTVGSTAPFIGLFGTVWGIYHALINIGVEGQASIDKVAGPVGEALIMTAVGLAVAVPAVLAYNLLIRRNKAVMDQVRDFADDLQSILIGGVRHGTTEHIHIRHDSSPTTTTISTRVD
ncbi:MAG: MotA/TolQ/ExbB proton channel family protein [Acetobacter sp.]|nr:MotA/TolQ/ExbB proton channel family protein [Acetobacter sp.]